MSSYWPNADPEDPRTRKLNSQPKYVASRTLRDVTWHNSTLLQGDLVAQTTALKKRHNEISIWGSSTLITPLLRHDLIDGFALMVFPIVAGGGKKLFNDGPAVGLELIEAKTSGTGVAVHTYRRTELPHLP